MSIIKKSIEIMEAANERYQKKQKNPFLKRLANEVTEEYAKKLNDLLIIKNQN